MRELFFTVLTVSLALSFTPGVAAQPPALNADEQRAAMGKIAWLAGSWEGEGWMEMRPGQRHHFKGTEKVEAHLDGLLLLVEGLHHDAETGDVAHHAFGMLTWDPREEIYRFRTQLANGMSSDSTGHFEDGAFVWSPPAPPGMDIRYVIRQDEEGNWYEIGEISRQGETRQIFEMRLRRVAE